MHCIHLRKTHNVRLWQQRMAYWWLWELYQMQSDVNVLYIIGGPQSRWQVTFAHCPVADAIIPLYGVSSTPSESRSCSYKSSASVSHVTAVGSQLLIITLPGQELWPPWSQSPRLPQGTWHGESWQSLQTHVILIRVTIWNCRHSCSNGYLWIALLTALSHGDFASIRAALSRYKSFLVYM